MLTVGSLFTGIGGFDLGLERAGMRVVWQCEQDEFCRRVLAKHWPRVPCHQDVRLLVAAEGSAQNPMSVQVSPVDVLAGGFPCQDISGAGKRAGIDGARSGLWSEYARLVGDLRPRYVVVENVADLLVRGLERVLGDLAALGYDAEWDCLPASAFGAPHRRDRIWLVAYPARLPEGWPSAQSGTVGQRARESGEPGDVANAEGERRKPRSGPSYEMGSGQLSKIESQGRSSLSPSPGRRADYWLVEPDVGRVAHGVPARVDRLRSLGNSLVPQIAEWIGRRIVAYEEGRLAA